MRIFRRLIVAVATAFCLALTPAMADTVTDFGKAAETWDAQISPDSNGL